MRSHTINPYNPDTCPWADDDHDSDPTAAASTAMHGVHGATATAAASAVPLYTFSPGVNLLGWTHTTHHLPLAQRGGVRKTALRPRSETPPGRFGPCGWCGGDHQRTVCESRTQAELTAAKEVLQEVTRGQAGHEVRASLECV